MVLTLAAAGASLYNREMTEERREQGARRWFTYMVRCADGSIYTGYTVDDIARRVAAHNAGRGARYTRSRRPVALVWSRELETARDARSLEARLKRLAKADKEALVRESGTAAEKEDGQA